ncbi:jg15217 [Pararge aegeria aegeria]|uniref:Jg15217 protein n=1 Tax=Pararge aegeria aegeria TaxID=348720 RepID=A0A8S4QET6_9NEOP|nr:jg15217 [Pararge aegeria aegeria]
MSRRAGAQCNNYLFPISELDSAFDDGVVVGHGADAPAAPGRAEVSRALRQASASAAAPRRPGGHCPRALLAHITHARRSGTRRKSLIHSNFTLFLTPGTSAAVIT